jgi:cytidyltransferase-like protein
MSIVYTGGTFDLFHVGHVQLLAACRKMAGPDGKVIVAVNPDEFVEEFKGVRPTIPLDERMDVLRACRYVDEVVENFGGTDSTVVLARYMPDIVAIGDDWAPPKDYYAQMGFDALWLNQRNVTLVYVDRNTGVSSSAIRERLRNQ